MTTISEPHQLALLGSALAIGLLIGLERGWKTRSDKEGTRIAGLRTYGLVGLLGGTSGIISPIIGTLSFGLVFLGFASATIVAYALQRSTNSDISITSLVATLLTFVLGAMCTLNMVGLAAPSAVVAVLILGMKDELHSWLQRIERKELFAVLKLALISIVMLPVLPDQGYGPWQALNPHEIWLMVVLIASISFIGYLTMKMAGPGKGVVFTALAAGLASSTALTMQYANMARYNSDMTRLLSIGILLACGTMFPRMLLVASLINSQLFERLAPPMLGMTAILWGACLFYWQRREKQPIEAAKLSNPVELKPALFFGLLLAFIILLGKATVAWVGHSGVLVLAALSGIADVDPINLTLAKMSTQEITISIAIMGIVIAATSNTFLKGILAFSIGGRGIGLRVMIPLFIAALFGVLGAWVTQ